VLKKNKIPLKITKKSPLWLIVVGLISVIAAGNYIDVTFDFGNPPAESLAQVVRIIDGDTIEVQKNNKTERVRLIGVDTPETKHPERGVECFGPESTEFTRKLVSGKTVRLKADTISANKDRYNRLLRYVYVEPTNEHLNAKLIETGHSIAYTRFDFEKKNEFVQLEQRAKNQALGLWGECEPPDKIY
jgi:micrococcal nuclease